MCSQDWPMLEKDVASLLGYGASSAGIRVMISNLKKRGNFIEGKDEDYFWDKTMSRPGSPSPYRRITLRGAIKIAQASRKPEATEFKRTQNIPDMKSTAIETECIGIIAKAIDGLTTSVPQYFVKGKNTHYEYRIDLYLDELNIAIECDEESHRYYGQYSENTRQEDIAFTLGCKFIRFNPHTKDFNIGVVINEILRELIGQKYSTLI